MRMIFATSLLDRLRGLLFRDAFEGEMVLSPCRDVHTFGMARDIDLAFVDSCGKVVLSLVGIPPRKRVRCPKACFAIERFSKGESPWYQEGDYLSLAVVRDEGRMA